MMAEAMLFALDKINENNGSFLFGNKLGARIYDSCYHRYWLRANIVDLINNDTQGVVGPQSSEEAILSSIALDLYLKSAVSFAATSPDLEDREKYRNLYRTVPSDEAQVQLMIELAIRFKWNFVAFVYSYGSYGQRAASLFKEKAARSGICIPVSYGFPRRPTQQHHIDLLTLLMSKQQVKVAFLFLTNADLKAFLGLFNKYRKNLRDITFVGSENWGGKISVPEEVDNNLQGALTIQVHSEKITEFEDYFLSLKPKSNTRNIWFSEFWEDVFNCSLKGNSTKFSSRCTGEEKLQAGHGYYEHTPIQTIINAVFVYAHIFREILQEKCLTQNITGTKCVESKQVLYHYKSTWDIDRKLSTVKFKEPFGNKTFSFNKLGAYNEAYDVLNIKIVPGTGKSVYVKVGHWETSHSIFQTSKDKHTNNASLTMHPECITWTSRKMEPPKSVCSMPCKIGSVSVPGVQFKWCCWECRACGLNDIVVNNTCVSCGIDYIHDRAEYNKCKKLPEKYLTVDNRIISVLLITTIIGLIVLLITTIIFIKNFNHRVVKASSRELCLFMLIGIAFTYLAPIGLVVKPSRMICAMLRLNIGLGFTMCYGPLMLKLNRVYRIFRTSSTKVTRPSMVSPRSQILMATGVTAVQIIIGVTSLAAGIPEVKKSYPEDRQNVIICCELNAFTVLVNLLYSSLLMAVSTWFAFKTRHFPKNYNETKFIGIAMYITCLILAAMLPAFFIIDSAGYNLKVFLLWAMCGTISTVNLIGLFGRNIVLLLRRENPTKITSWSSNPVYINSRIIANDLSQLKTHAVIQRGTKDS